MDVQSIAQMLSVILYTKRFFPYYTFNILGGLDEKGVGAVYSYDPVGSFERENYRAGGSASALIQPFLDSQVSNSLICRSD
jgi:20S proteasome subunit beta 6